ncbi:MAG TPA: lysylphosphatidylglycerol synthase transmembrane domain-containing protein [Polyangiaceae bacterium]|nr:lysylphosphatidylglycerol synthase transmembrane domain-containing protein [Polyangiaceae bacterium]
MTSATPPTPPARGKIVPKLVLSLVATAALVWIMKSGSLPIVPPSKEFARVAGWTLPAYFGVWAVAYFVRLARWYLLLAPVEEVPLRTVLRVNAVGLFAIALLPFRMGEVLRPLMIRKNPRLTFWAASGTIAGERILDGLSVSVLLLLGLRIASPRPDLPDHIGAFPIHVEIVPRAAFVSALFFTSVCVVMAIFYFWRAWARQMTEVVIGLVSLKFARWLAGKIEQMAEGLGFLAYRRYSVPYVSATVLYWFLNAACFWVLACGCGLGHIGYFGAVATMGVVALGILFPATPGFFGPFQLATYAALAMYLDADAVTGVGSVYAFLAYTLPIGLTTVVGIIGILLKPSALLNLASEPRAEANAAPKTWPAEREQATAER